MRAALVNVARRPFISSLAVCLLALGIGTNLAVYSLLDAVLWRPVVAHNPDELVYLYRIYREDRPPSVLLHDEYRFFRDHGEAFSSVTAHWGMSAPLTVDGETSIVRGEAVSANYFDVVGIPAMFGRVFLDEDDLPSQTQPALIISHTFWIRRFGASHSALGREVQLGEKTFTIVGIAAPTFKGLSDPWTPSEFWVTFTQWWGSERGFGLQPIARLEPHVSPQLAQTIVTAQQAQVNALLPRSDGRPVRYLALPVNSVRTPFNPTAQVIPQRLAVAMIAVAGTVLIIAVANVAAMLLSYAVARRADIAMRLALGATRLRVGREMIAETLWLATGGGLLGAAVGYWLLHSFHALTPARYALDATLDQRALIFAMTLCAITGVAAGVVSACGATRIDAVKALAGGVVETSHLRALLRRSILIPQVALSFVLSLVAGMYVSDLWASQSPALGYDADRPVVIGINTRNDPSVRSATSFAKASELRVSRSRQIYGRLRDSLTPLAQTRKLGMTDMLPFRTHSATQPVLSDDAFARGEVDGPQAGQVAISPGYFGAMGIRLLGGRDFDDRDNEMSPRVAIVSASLAKRLWPEQEAVGRELTLSPQKPDWAKVIGVVNDVSPIVIDTKQNPIVYVLLNQEGRTPFSIVASSEESAGALIQTVRRAVEGADPAVIVLRAMTARQHVAEILYPRRAAATLLVVFGCAGLFLSSVGVYGLLSYSVAQRRRELSIRASLGAAASQLMRIVMAEGARIIVVGSAAGGMLAFATLRFSSTLIPNVPQLDWATVVVVLGLLWIIILLACYLPARRAAASDPAALLRQL